ncbi:MAG: type II secretion system F family protein [Armatimonadetes bacterium]|jgi:type IV pilus assembly protein PilC|nr:type II secretion system F family protein [Armatimonadota bacterium]
MATYAYSAVDPGGKSVKGRIEAENEQLVLAKLHEQRYHVLSVSEDKSRAKSSAKGTSSKKVKLASMVVFSRQFATMIDAGVAIVRCLDILEGQTKDPALKPVIASCKKDVKGGLSLTDAFSKHPNVFSRLYVNMVKAAETGGILDKILDRLATFLEDEQEIRGKIKGAMIYPILVLVFALLMVVALLLFVLPKFKEIFDSMNVEMPAATRFLFGLSGFAQRYWYIGFGAAFGGFMFYKWYSQTDTGARQIDMLKLKLPIVGELVQKMAISRFSRTFATLIASGVPMMRSLEIVGETSGNRVIAQTIENARNAIREGQKISTPLAQSSLFPGMVTHMIDIGEETGRLSEMLAKVSDFYDSEVENAVKTLTSLIEPCLIVTMGGIVGFIAVSIMAPIFKLISNIN